LGEEIEKKEKADALEIEKKSSNEPESVQTDACKTPSAPEAVPIPYPNTAMASDTSSGSKTVKTEGKMPSVKDDDFKESVGDEAGTSDDGSETGILMEIVKTKVLGVPLWIWGLMVVAVLVVLWILSSNSPQPIAPLE
jgi:cobalamin biosynthesis Mg chelatase CobN